MSTAQLEFVDLHTGPMLQLSLKDERWLGQDAELKWERVLRTRESGGVTSTEACGPPERLRLSARQLRVPLPADALPAFRGDLLDLSLRATLGIAPGKMFSPTLTAERPAPEPAAPRLAPTGDCTQEIDPKDHFHFRDNLRALEPWRRLLVLAMVALGGLLILINTAVGARDTFVPESEVWFYDHRSSDGDGELPILKSLIGSGGVGFTLWVAILAQLRRYLTVIEWADLPNQIGPDTRLPLATMFRAVSRVPLENFEVRVVAANIEVGIREVKERTRNGTRTRRDTVRRPLRTLVLQVEHVVHAAPGTNLAAALRQEVDFRPLFQKLYPAFQVGEQRLELRWELQLLHPRYVDQELLGPDRLDPAGFAEIDAQPVRDPRLSPGALPGA
jgi:hypothetical protein